MRKVFSIIFLIFFSLLVAGDTLLDTKNSEKSNILNLSNKNFSLDLILTNFKGTEPIPLKYRNIYIKKPEPSHYLEYDDIFYNYLIEDFQEDDRFIVVDDPHKDGITLLSKIKSFLKQPLDFDYLGVPQRYRFIIHSLMSIKENKDHRTLLQNTNIESVDIKTKTYIDEIGEIYYINEFFKEHCYRFVTMATAGFLLPEKYSTNEEWKNFFGVEPVNERLEKRYLSETNKY